MFQPFLTPARLAMILSGALLVPSVHGGQLKAPAVNDPNVQTEDLKPFTHIAYIPAQFEPGSVRLENVRMVQVPVTLQRRTDATYCAGLAFRDPGGSEFCSDITVQSKAAAYKVTYSFISEPMASDESASRRFTFSVYFDPAELTPEVKKAVSARKPNRADIARYFTVNTSREAQRRLVIENDQSKFCPGSYVDGAWTHNDPDCRDDIHYGVTMSPSDYVTISVGAAPKAAKVAIVAAGN
jgi:hypothetical protein